jgi:hypothetical protein
MFVDRVSSRITIHSNISGLSYELGGHTPSNHAPCHHRSFRRCDPTNRPQTNLRTFQAAFMPDGSVRQVYSPYAPGAKLICLLTKA